MIKLSTLKTNPNNPRLIKDDKFHKLVKSIEQFPQMMELRPIIIDKNNVIQGGNMRFKALQHLGFKEIPESYVKQGKDLTEEQWREFVIKDNVGFGEWSWEQLANQWDTEQLTEWGLDLPVWDLNETNEDEETDVFDGIFDDIETDETETPEAKQQIKKLSDRFIIPPLSILDTKLGQWQQRKNYWLSLGIKSELGRDGGLTYAKSAQAPIFYQIKSELKSKNLPCDTDTVYQECKNRGYQLFGNEDGSTSIFDPVLCELVYRWFNIENGKILDCFAGGSVRGIVAAKIGFQYLGNDLNGNQIEANRINAIEVLKESEIYPTWTTGDSLNIDVIAKDYEADLLFSCPPYADLEVYSKKENDISNMPYDKFIVIYNEIIKKSCEKLKDNRFAVFVVGEVRDKKGMYLNFVSDTIKAFLNCGLGLYNEMILVNQIGSGAMRAGSLFNATRKIVKHHQNVLVFYKGDPKKIKENYKELDLSYLQTEKTEENE